MATKKTATLLEQAQAVSRKIHTRTRKDYTEQDLDLVLAFLKGELSYREVGSVIHKPAGSVPLYASSVMRFMRDRINIIKLEK